MQGEPGPRKSAVFFDRDGTLAVDVPYCSRVEDFQFYPETMAALKQISDCDLMILVATNQSGLGRGYFSREALQDIHSHMLQEVSAAGARIDDVFYCPHHPDDACECRKPRAGLLIEAGEKYGLDLGRSFLVGDNETDVQAAHAAGCRAVLVTREGGPKTTRADACAEDLVEAVSWIMRELTDAVPS